MERASTSVRPGVNGFTSEEAWGVHMTFIQSLHCLHDLEHPRSLVRHPNPIFAGLRDEGRKSSSKLLSLEQGRKSSPVRDPVEGSVQRPSSPSQA